MRDFLKLVFISLLIHLTLFLSVIGLSVIFPYSPAPREDLVEIEILADDAQSRQKVRQEQQIVRQADAPEEKNLSDDQEARFLSEKTQRVRKESQAAASGLTQNRKSLQQQNTKNIDLAQLTKTSREAMPPEKRFHQKIEDSNDGDFAQKEKPRPEREMEAFAEQTERLQDRKRSESLPSTSSEALPPDVSVGSINALNTDRLTYYSFYSRVNEAIYFRWNSRVKNSLDSFDRNYLRNVVRLNRWVTQAEILLRPDGRVHKVLIMKESGILQFDLAAANAFKDAATFPNPPQEMIQDDGFIHLKYSFTVAIN